MTTGAIRHIAIVIVALAAACSRPESMPSSAMTTLPGGGWLGGTALRLTPHYGDSTRRYDLRLNLRHTTDFPYRDIHLLVDLIGDGGHVERRIVNIDLADDYGNWTGSGFGTLYQHSVPLAAGVEPRRAHTVAVWQSMDSVERITGIDAIGVTAFPTE